MLKDDAGHWGIETTTPAVPGTAAFAIFPPAGWTPASPAAPTPAADAPAASQPSNAPGGDLFNGPAATTPATAPAEFVRVADCKDKGWVIDESAPQDLPQGTMVFIGKP